MSREEVIALLRQYQLADIIKAVQAAYAKGYKDGRADTSPHVNYDDDIPF